MYIYSISQQQQEQQHTCKVKLASTRPAWFWDTHINGPESSGLAWVKTKVEVFSKPPVSWITNCCCPLLTSELFRISVPSRYHWTLEEGTDPILQDKVAFSPEKTKTKQNNVHQIVKLYITY